MKHPWIKFYVRDWMAETSIRTLSAHDRGVWIDMLCVMAMAEPYGTMSIGGKPMSDEQACRSVGLALAEYQDAVTRLEAAGTLSRAETGAVMSRRMVKDYNAHLTGKKNGGRGGNPLLSGSETRTQIPEPRTHTEVNPFSTKGVNPTLNPPDHDNTEERAGGDVLEPKPETKSEQDAHRGNFPAEAEAYRQIMDTRNVVKLVWPDFLRICRTYPKSGMCDANLTEVLAIVMNEAGGVKNGFSFLSRVASRLEEKQTGSGSGRGSKTYVSRFK